MDYKDKTVLIADHGLFCELAPRLARDFGQTLYFSPWISGYPKAAPDNIGRGLPGVKRLSNFWDGVAEADIVVFPDLYFADLQRELAEKYPDKPVWGHRLAETLELDRWSTRDLQESIGLPTPKTEFITGLDDLEKYLREPKNENQWVKLSTYRGDGETFHHQSWHATSIWLDHFRNRVGALAGRYEFLVEEHIDGIEVGYDGWTVRGEWPSGTFWGFEVKDKGYIGCFADYEDLPKPIRAINDKMSPILANEKAVGFCSFEFRLTKDGTAYMIDPCLRAGSPPFEGTQEAYKNLSEIIFEGANGRMAEPEPLGKYLAMAMIHAPFALTNWVPIDVPEKDRRWLKLRNVAVIRGKLYHVPTQGEMPEVGAVVAVADDLDEAINLVRERAERVKGYNLEIHVDALDEAQAEIDKAGEYGITFG